MNHIYFRTNKTMGMSSGFRYTFSHQSKKKKVTNYLKDQRSQNLENKKLWQDIETRKKNDFHRTKGI